MKHLVLIGRDDRFTTVEGPGSDEGIGELTADFHEEGPRPDGGVAYFEIENLGWEWVFAEIGEDGLERLSDDRLSELAGGVVGA